MTFQAVIATDGRTSFAALIYPDPNNEILLNMGSVGFFGNRRRFFNADIPSLERVNLYRIDGMERYSKGIKIPLLLLSE